jgi:hypothetical protein
MLGRRPISKRLAELKRGKSRSRDDPVEAEKDRADFATLSRLA